jgi:hypothetical protein
VLAVDRPRSSRAGRKCCPAPALPTAPGSSRARRERLLPAALGVVPAGTESQTGPCEPTPTHLLITPPDETQPIAVPWPYGPVCQRGRIDQTDVEAHTRSTCSFLYDFSRHGSPGFAVSSSDCPLFFSGVFAGGALDGADESFPFPGSRTCRVGSGWWFESETGSEREASGCVEPGRSHLDVQSAAAHGAPGEGA